MPQDGLTRLRGPYWPDTNPAANKSPGIHNNSVRWNVPGPSSLGCPGLRPLAAVRPWSVRARDQLTGARLILTASSQAGGRQQPAACVCKESESEPVTAAAAVLCQHSLQSGVSWRRPSGSSACHGPTIPLATHPVHLTGIHSDFSLNAFFTITETWLFLRLILICLF